MKRSFLPLLTLCSAMLLFASCLGDSDNELVSYNDAAITGFSVNSLKRVVHTTSKSGADSTYTTTFTTSDYKFYIDQLNKLIYNADSLPAGTDASKVVCTITAKNGGTIAIQNIDNDSVKYFNSSDSLDFTKPRKIIVYNNAGTAMNTYTVQVNVHQQTADEFKWSNPVKSNAYLGALTAMKMLTMGEQVYLFGNKDTEPKIYTASRSSGANWQELTPNISLTSKFYQNVVAQGTTFYAYDGGKILKSTDAKTWTVVSSVQLKQLVGAGHTNLYGLTTDNKVMVSPDQGATWTADPLSSSATLLPQDDINFVVQPQKTNTDVNRLLLVGTTATNVSMWGKIEENDPASEDQPWIYYTPAADTPYTLPNLTNLQVVRYGEALVAIGGTGKGNSSGIAAFNQLYYSRDGGLTWKKHATLTLPKNFQSSKTAFAMTSDTDNYLWIVCGETGQVWKGRLNELGWQDVKKEFTE